MNQENQSRVENGFNIMGGSLSREFKKQKEIFLQLLEEYKQSLIDSEDHPTRGELIRRVDLVVARTGSHFERIKTRRDIDQKQRELNILLSERQQFINDQPEGFRNELRQWGEMRATMIKMYDGYRNICIAKKRSSLLPDNTPLASFLDERDAQDISEHRERQTELYQGFQHPDSHSRLREMDVEILRLQREVADLEQQRYELDEKIQVPFIQSTRIEPEQEEEDGPEQEEEDEPESELDQERQELRRLEEDLAQFVEENGLQELDKIVDDFQQAIIRREKTSNYADLIISGLSESHSTATKAVTAVKEQISVLFVKKIRNKRSEFGEEAKKHDEAVMTEHREKKNRIAGQRKKIVEMEADEFI